MKTNTLATRPIILHPIILQSYTVTGFNDSIKARRQQTGVVKLLPPPPHPDEKTLIELNALAAKHPFCILHKVKKHDPL